RRRAAPARAAAALRTARAGAIAAAPARAAAGLAVHALRRVRQGQLRLPQRREARPLPRALDAQRGGRRVRLRRRREARGRARARRRLPALPTGPAETAQPEPRDREAVEALPGGSGAS